MGDVLVGSWKVDRSENFDDFLKEMGVNFMIRKMAGAARPVQTIEKDGDHWTITSQAMKQQVTKFQIDVPFETDDPSGGKSKGTATLQGDVLIVTTKGDNGKTVKSTRQVIDDELVQTMEVGSVVCKRIHKRQ